MFEVVASQLVTVEATLGDPGAARRRFETLDGIAVLPTNSNLDSIANEIIKRRMMPANAMSDALPVAATKRDLR
ncbi:MAG: hypothetical protein EA381_14110 [Planctomycetaceae bacterium]|nr:MAG: hypothetical protein EA381_14110 [Planctomycetaceae bacterium]